MIYDKAHDLAKALKLSPEYRQYQEAKVRVGTNSENLKMVQDFRVMQMEIQTMQIMGQEIPPEQLHCYEKMAELLNYHPAVRDFLQAEYRVAQMFADIQKILTAALDLELPEMK